MREFAWYSPEYNWIVFQWIMDGCYIAFVWDNLDAYDAVNMWGTECDPMGKTTWIPLWEV